MFQQHFALQAKLAGGCRRLSNMIRLHCANGNDGIGTFLPRVAHGKLELARFIAAGRKTGTVIALHVYFRTAKMFA
jgi:hypothetical protein